MTVFIVMGVSGAGKSTIGRKLADQLQIPFFEGDDFHPETNKAKMSQGIALQNSDRHAWIVSLAISINEIDSDCVASCSALNPIVRDWINQEIEQDVQFVCLSATKEVLLKRLQARSEHFFPPELLDSQFNALELSAEIPCVNVQQPIEKVIRDVLDIFEET